MKLILITAALISGLTLGYTLPTVGALFVAALMLGAGITLCVIGYRDNPRNQKG